MINPFKLRSIDKGKLVVYREAGSASPAQSGHIVDWDITYILIQFTGDHSPTRVKPSEVSWPSS